ncbi:response regulator transcription factor [Marinoscillum sp. MHG1-6]|uniref:response regulator n=1 Tax=Marinoscillum sp. MHG1-6 TaxID=2959627 RepID=UPI00215736BC|nr:response regulator transcription factor [Marinoscillum sp. MHG1-6]
MIKVILADDHEIVRNGIKLLLESETEIEVIGEASDGQETIDVVHELNPDVLIVDIRMPMFNGLEVTEKLKQEGHPTRILVLTMHDDSEYILKSLKVGADGYLLKDTGKQEFVKAIKMVYDNQKYFSGDISSTIVNSYLNTGLNPPAAPVINGENDYQLTKREKEILRLIYEGISNKEIAEKLGKSVRTIETHRFNIMKKLDVNNITELLRKVDREGILA